MIVNSLHNIIRLCSGLWHALYASAENTSHEYIRRWARTSCSVVAFCSTDITDQPRETHTHSADADALLLVEVKIFVRQHCNVIIQFRLAQKLSLGTRTRPVRNGTWCRVLHVVRMPWHTQQNSVPCEQISHLCATFLPVCHLNWYTNMQATHLLGDTHITHMPKRHIFDHINILHAVRNIRYKYMLLR